MKKYGVTNVKSKIGVKNIVETNSFSKMQDEEKSTQNEQSTG
jgi:hypothetical protein